MAKGGQVIRFDFPGVGAQAEGGDRNEQPVPILFGMIYALISFGFYHARRPGTRLAERPEKKR